VAAPVVPEPVPAPIVDPVMTQVDTPVGDQVRDHVRGPIDEALASLAERYESSTKLLADLFKHDDQRQRLQGFYDAAGIHDSEMSSGSRFDATA